MARELEQLQLIQLPSTELSNLLTEFGIIQPPSLLFLSNVVQPISIVDSRVSLSSVTTPANYTNAGSSGPVTPAAATVIATTGPLAAGTYEFRLMMDSNDGVARRVDFQHRDAADATSLLTHRLIASATSKYDFTLTRTLVLNERVRIITVDAFGSPVQATLFWRSI